MTMHNYTDYQALILKLAHIWNDRSNRNVEFEELVAEGNLAFCIADQKFNPNKKIQFSTYLYTVVNNAMCDFSKSNGHKRKFETLAEEVSNFHLFSIPRSESPESMTRFKQWIGNLSKESQFLINLVFETPAEIVQWAREETYHPKNTQKNLTRYLRSSNWKWDDIRFCFQEIKQELKEII